MSPYIYTVGMLLGVVGMANFRDFLSFDVLTSPEPPFFQTLAWVVSFILAIACFTRLALFWAFPF